MNTPILRSPSDSRTCHPALATAAPAIPPTNACDELVGSPRKKVMRFQPIAPTSPANTTASVIDAGSTTPVAMVVATFVPNTRNAAKLKNAAHATAKRGESTRVDTTVAIELAASWKPLTKSKPSATATTTTRARVCTRKLGVLQDDALDDVGDVLDVVHGLLDRFDDVLPLQHVERFELAREEVRHDAAVHAIPFALEPSDGFELRLHVAQPRQLRDQGDVRLRRLHQDVGQVTDLGKGLDHPVQHEEVGGGLHLVDHVVELLGERVDVLAVEGRDEALVEAEQDRAGDLVAARLAVVDQVDQLLDVPRTRVETRIVGVVI